MMGFPDIESRNRALGSVAGSVKWRARFLVNLFPRFAQELDDIEQFAWLMLLRAAKTFRSERGSWVTHSDRCLGYLKPMWFKYKATRACFEWESLDSCLDHGKNEGKPRFQIADLSQSRAFNCIEFGVSAERRKRQQRAAMRKARGLSVEKMRALEERFLLAA